MSKTEPQRQVPRLATRSDLVELVTGQILRQANQTAARILERLSDLEEAIDMIARQVQRDSRQP